MSFLDTFLMKSLFIVQWFFRVFVGSRWTAHGLVLRKVLPHSGLGTYSSRRGESLCRGSETTQPMNNAMIQVVVEVFVGIDETCQSAPGASLNGGISCPDCSQVRRLVECCLKTEGGLRPTPNILLILVYIFSMTNFYN